MNRVISVGFEHPKSYLDSNQSVEAKSRIDSYIDKKMDEWNKEVVYAKHLYEPSVNKEYYKRHMIEHVWRIRMSRTVQAKALHQIAKISPEAAQLYARYQDEEMLHDILFKQDALALGVTEDTIKNTEPMFATRLLMGFKYFVAEHENPLGAVAYSYLVEYVTAKITPDQVSNLKSELGSENIKGQVAHINTDLSHDHSGDMWEIVRALLFTESDIEMFIKYIDEIQDLLAMYFKELYEKTIAKNESQAA
ncbi:hypothetical protein Sden_3472 [Shewanella denitrificans OS217]|jgi:pyrroloquinoline quinone (PQQ) biosynthesis protein C|uniref:Iron-containing redox enzyme family protein n=1 Tax=Shewanella denitrificans (strain OS217 / ATCC BAA-1090 / DSM 15013) TaxID=318161 RepID=Q12IH9_SHEDO|nr:iron-containing redox enzyme family protein [Shewanella denitrificans]ABE56747.1 hypothetical protein Sden_3472 [Shewanella denitrificans OS217]